MKNGKIVNEEISLEILKQCSLNWKPEMFITKRNKTTPAVLLP